MISLESIDQKYEESDSVKDVKEYDSKRVWCKGRSKNGCKRYLRYRDNAPNQFLFEEIKCEALREASFLNPVDEQQCNPGFCIVCKPSEMQKAVKHFTAPKKGWWRKKFELDDLADYCEEGGPKKFNPIWTGKDEHQIGVFVRNLKIEAVHEEEQTISIHFILNLVWLDKALCALVKKEKSKKDEWFIQMSVKEYEELFKRVERDPGTLELPTTQEKTHNPLPNVKIWNASTTDGYEVRENVISLNKKHIGKNTVYWRRIMRVKLNCEYTSRGFPFGYETFKMSIRFMSRTDQHLVLMRTYLWWNVHAEQCKKELLADHTFAYIHPDNKGLKDWKVCSVHDCNDMFYSVFDNNDLSFRLPVRVTDGRDTQSRFEALIILKRSPGFILANIWLYFALTSSVSLLTYFLDPINDRADRLAIAVAIIFVQMGLKWDSGRKTPRVKYVTCLDYHVILSLSLVVFQAVGQVILSLVFSDKALNKANYILLTVNAIAVMLENIGTLLFAMLRKKWKRKSLEFKLSSFTGFNENPISGYLKGEIEDTLRIKEMQDNYDLQISNTKVVGWVNPQASGNREHGETRCSCMSVAERTFNFFCCKLFPGSSMRLDE